MHENIAVGCEYFVYLNLIFLALAWVGACVLGLLALLGVIVERILSWSGLRELVLDYLRNRNEYRAWLKGKMEE